ncbi:hypothetical protein KAU11_01875, partial [Candidatus Babeliales bacterium]|nr:hypothetical protein [Candidatus Babeliales bacterium]
MNKIALLNVAVCCLSISTTLSSMSKMPRDFNERLSGDSFAQIARDMVLPEKVLRACTWIDNNKAEMLLRKIFSVKVINDDKQKKLLKFFTLLGRLSEDLFSKEMTY